MGLYKALDRKGINYVQTAVGDKYVYENMLANGHSIGGEQSGHIIFAKHGATGDGILTSLKIMEVMLESKAKLSELCKDLIVFPQLLVNVRVKDKSAVGEDPVVKELIERLESQLGADGRILVRESGTEPLIRVMVEAKSDDLCKEIVDKIVEKIREQGHELDE